MDNTVYDKLWPEITLTVNALQQLNLKVIIIQQTTGLILGLRPANERRRYKVTPSLIGWAQT